MMNKIFRKCAETWQRMDSAMRNLLTLLSLILLLAVAIVFIELVSVPAGIIFYIVMWFVALFITYKMERIVV